METQAASFKKTLENLLGQSEIAPVFEFLEDHLRLVPDGEKSNLVRKSVEMLQSKLDTATISNYILSCLGKLDPNKENFWDFALDFAPQVAQSYPEGFLNYIRSCYASAQDDLQRAKSLELAQRQIMTLAKENINIGMQLAEWTLAKAPIKDEALRKAGSIIPLLIQTKGLPVAQDFAQRILVDTHIPFDSRPSVDMPQEGFLKGSLVSRCASVRLGTATDSEKAGIIWMAKSLIADIAPKEPIFALYLAEWCIHLAPEGKRKNTARALGRLLKTPEGINVTMTEELRRPQKATPDSDNPSGAALAIAS